MISEHMLWWGLTMTCMAWYCTITVYVAIKGFADIKEMLTRLGRKRDDSIDGRPGQQDQRKVGPR